jgi:hypothetical protein
MKTKFLACSLICLSVLANNIYASDELIDIEIEETRGHKKSDPEVVAKQENPKNNVFTQQEVSTILDAATKPIETAPNTDKEKTNNESLVDTKNKLKNKLNKYKVTGVAIASDFNFAFVYNNQKPEFEVKYKDDKGNLKKRKYQANIKSWGTKFELEYKYDLIFFTNTEFNFYETNKEIEFGLGVDIKTNLLDFTYVNFQNAPGGMIIVGIPTSNLIFKGITTATALVNYNKYKENVLAQTKAQLNALQNMKIINQKTKEYSEQNTKIQLDNALAQFLNPLSPIGIGISIVISGSLTPVNA